MTVTCCCTIFGWGEMAWSPFFGCGSARDRTVV